MVQTKITVLLLHSSLELYQRHKLTLKILKLLISGKGAMLIQKILHTNYKMPIALHAFTFVVPL